MGKILRAPGLSSLSRRLKCSLDGTRLCIEEDSRRVDRPRMPKTKQPWHQKPQIRQKEAHTDPQLEIETSIQPHFHQFPILKLYIFIAPFLLSFHLKFKPKTGLIQKSLCNYQIRALTTWNLNLNHHFKQNLSRRKIKTTAFQIGTTAIPNSQKNSKL